MSTSSENLSTAEVVLCISGHDPSGGAGLQADIEAIQACGGYPQTIPSCLTVQNHRSVKSLSPLSATLLDEMLGSLLDVHKPAAIKVGLLGSAEQAEILASHLSTLPDELPVVLDPVIRASDGTLLSDPSLIAAIRETLLPQITLLTPNHSELALLSEQEETPNAIARIQALGCGQILLTGGDDNSPDVHNQLFSVNGDYQDWRFTRLPQAFHGTGCTLASACACYLAQGLAVADACTQAQHFTQRTLQQAIRLDDGPCIPLRR